MSRERERTVMSRERGRSLVERERTVMSRERGWS